MSLMVKRKKPDPPDDEAQPARRSGENLNVWVRAEIVDAIRAFLASVRPRTTKTAVVEQALEDFLRAKGLWPSDDPSTN